jgi:hypothetical protein
LSVTEKDSSPSEEKFSASEGEEAGTEDANRITNGIYSSPEGEILEIKDAEAVAD